MQMPDFLSKISDQLMKKVIPYTLSGIIGAIAAYLTDRNFLDSEGADAFANALLQIVTQIIDKVL